MKNIIIIIFVVAIFTPVFALGIKRNDHMVCEKWKQQHEQYPLHEYTQNEVEHCQKIGFEL